MSRVFQQKPPPPHLIIPENTAGEITVCNSVRGVLHGMANAHLASATADTAFNQRNERATTDTLNFLVQVYDALTIDSAITPVANANSGGDIQLD